jgi:hypothetical protein
MLFLYAFNSELAIIYSANTMMGDVTCGIKAMPYLNRSISILNSWLINFDSKDRSSELELDLHGQNPMEMLLQALVNTE